jgi:hypothetical protein
MAELVSFRHCRLNKAHETSSERCEKIQILAHGKKATPIAGCKILEPNL